MNHCIVVVEAEVVYRAVSASGVQQCACSQCWIWFPVLYGRTFSLLVFKFWLHLVSRAAHRLPLAAESRDDSSLWGVGFSFQWVLWLGSPGSSVWDSVVVLHRLSPLQQVGFSRTRDQAQAACIGRWILNHCTTREVPVVGPCLSVLYMEVCVCEPQTSMFTCVIYGGVFLLTSNFHFHLCYKWRCVSVNFKLPITLPPARPLW